MIFSKTRKELPFDEDQLKDDCLQEVKTICDYNKNTGMFDQQKCLDAASNAITRKYLWARGYKKSSQLEAEDVEELNGLRAKIWDGIVEDVRKMVLDYATQYKAKQITKTTADIYIRSALSEAGYTNFHIICQCFRAKVTIITPSKYKMMFIVRYKDIMSGKMGSILDQFINLTQSVELLPFQVKIWK